jgi:hypothetical protein
VRSFVYQRFPGIDTRPGQFGDDTPALVEASNVSVRTGGSIGRRPSLVKSVDLDSESVGLYARGGRLHSIIPGGRSIQANQPFNVVFDPIGDGSPFPLGVLERLVGADTYGVDPVYGPNGYVAVKRSDTGKVEHHWIKAPPALITASATTRVGLPFLPGDSLIKLTEKMFAPAPAEGTVRFSSTENGPGDWAAVEDAGFVPVQSHLSGSRDLLTLCHYRGNLAAFFYDAVQLWRADADPEFIELLQQLNGPGAMLAGAVANVLGDVIFLSRGGWRTLSTATVTGEANENDVGAGIRSLTDALDTDTPAVSLWSQTRSQFLCAIGTRLFAWTYLPTEKLAAWTTWTLPVTLDYLVELDGQLWARGGDTLYRFVDGGTTDLNGTDVETAVETRALGLGAPGMRKTIHWLTIQQTAASTVQLIIDGVPLAARPIPACSPRPLRIPVVGEGRQVAVRITTTSVDWRLEGLAIEYEPQGA